MKEKRDLIVSEDPNFSIEKQCKLLELSRSSYYYERKINQIHLKTMHEMDRIYTEHPYFGKRRMSFELKRLGYNVGIELARSLMITMGIEAIYQKPNLSKSNPNHQIYPYLLRGICIERTNQVWSTDITYIRMRNGFLYLTVVIDWYSRYVIAWKLSNSLDGRFCREVLQEALKVGKPEIFNTDQGVQYTSLEFIGILQAAKVRISMDGKGRALDNVWVERLWRTIKYEDIYIRDYQNGQDLFAGLEKYFAFYNTQRLHSSLNYQTPQEVYLRGRI